MIYMMKLYINVTKLFRELLFVILWIFYHIFIFYSSVVAYIKLQQCTEEKKSSTNKKNKYFSTSANHNI